MTAGPGARRRLALAKVAAGDARSRTGILIGLQQP